MGQQNGGARRAGRGRKGGRAKDRGDRGSPRQTSGTGAAARRTFPTTTKEHPMKAVTKFLALATAGLTALLAVGQAAAGLAPAGNTITNLIPLLYAALDTVQRELVGFIPAVSRDSSAERAALNQTINIYIAPPATTADVTPGVTAPNDGDQVFGNTTMTINKSKYSPIRWNGEEWKSLDTNPVRRQVVQDQFTQSMRAVVNLVEIDLANAAYQGASRSYGTAGAAPFGTAADLSDIAQPLKILDDNGAPQSDRHLILGTTAMANIR